MILKFKTKSGHICDGFEVEELIEVDGRPFNETEKPNDLAAAIAHVAGRVTTLENILYQREEPEQK